MIILVVQWLPCGQANFTYGTGLGELFSFSILLDRLKKPRLPGSFLSMYIFQVLLYHSVVKDTI